MRRTVLVVDDDLASSALCAEALATAGYAVVTANDGERALQLAVERHPALVLTDLYLPLLDGVQLLSELRERGVDAPVIMMSGSVEGRVRAFRCHADGFLEKPFIVKEAIEMVDGLLRTRGAA